MYLERKAEIVSAREIKIDAKLKKYLEIIIGHRVETLPKITDFIKPDKTYTDEEFAELMKEYQETIKNYYGAEEFNYHFVSSAINLKIVFITLFSLILLLR